MRTKAQIIELLLNPGVIAVIRARDAAHVRPACEALIRGGIVALEITMTVPGAIEVIWRVAEDFGGRALVGAGTVLDERACERALEAGAQFVVSPIVAPRVARLAAGQGKPAMLGAYTPTEAQAAHEAGADFVKLFPAKTLGPGYIKSLLAPLPHLKIVPTGGVDLGTMEAFFRAGSVAVGVGSSLIQPKLVESGDWESLAALARKFTDLRSAIRAGPG